MWAAAALLCLLGAVAGHAIACRLPLRTNSVVRFVVVAAIIGGWMLYVNPFKLGTGTRLWASLLIYALGCELYLFLFTLVGSSVSVALILALSEQTLDESEIEARYSSNLMIEQRFERLRQNGLLSLDGHGYSVTREGERLLTAFRCLRRVFKHPDADGTLWSA